MSGGPSAAARANARKSPISAVSIISSLLAGRSTGRASLAVVVGQVVLEEDDVTRPDQPLQPRRNLVDSRTTVIFSFGKPAATSPSRIGRVRFGPTRMTASQTPAAASPSARFSASSRSPSSTIPGVTRTLRPSAICWSVRRAARAPSGFELYASSITVTPPAPSISWRRCGTGSTRSAARAISSTDIPSAIAAAAAARKLATLCSPSSRSRTAASPCVFVTRRNSSPRRVDRTSLAVRSSLGLSSSP